MSDKSLRNIHVAIIVLGALLLGAAIGGVVQSMRSTPSSATTVSSEETQTLTTPQTLPTQTNTPTTVAVAVTTADSPAREATTTRTRMETAIATTPTSKLPTLPATTTLETIVPVTVTFVTVEPETRTPTGLPTYDARAEATPIQTTTTPKEPLDLSDVDYYFAYRVGEDDSLASISEQGGTTLDLLMQYNRLSDQEQPVGRELIIPKLVGQTSTLTEANLGVVKGNTSQPWVALTIDCGTFDVHGEATLDAIATTDAQVTFFIHGDTIGNNPEQVQRVVADGHELGNHSFSHPNFTQITDEEIVEQLTRTEQKVQEAAGEEVTLRPYFRFPFGESNDHATSLVIANGYIPIYWNLNLLDYEEETQTAAGLVERLTTALPEEELPASIVLMHCSDEVIEALPTMVSELEERGLEARTLSEVLGP